MEQKKMYLSFADDNNGGFRGACVVYGADITSATKRASELGINPGGNVLCVEVPEGCGSYLPMDRLLTKADIDQVEGGGVSVGEMTDDELALLWAHTR